MVAPVFISARTNQACFKFKAIPLFSKYQTINLHLPHHSLDTQLFLVITRLFHIKYHDMPRNFIRTQTP